MTTREKDHEAPTNNGGRFAAPTRPAATAALRPRLEDRSAGLAPLADDDHLPQLADPRPDMEFIDDTHGGWWRGRIAMTHLIAEHQAMVGTINSGRTSDSTGEPVELCLHEGTDAHFEVTDGHHRLTDALRDGDTDIDVLISAYYDDEPYDGDYFDFAGIAAPHTSPA